MNDAGPSLGPFVAFLGGLLSFLSPCVLPLVPSYLGFITGFTLEEMGNRRRLAMIHATLFVIGFSLVFILLGASATALGSALRFYKDAIMRVGGVLIVFFGLYCLGIIKLGFLSQERRMHLDRKPIGFLGSVLVGMAFGAGWSPCIGPILGGILSLAATEADLGRGVWLLVAYSAGLAVPFLVAAFAVESFLDWFQKFRRHLNLVQKVSGVLLVVVGLLIATGQFTRLAGYLQKLTPDFLVRLL
ncbi:MAG: cytochrome c biogenesis protein CcdA [Gemmatimonadales bacterium]|nr:cytochrome c biogenesis protein CcdA [Gemmatimonadales bacterium]